MKPVLLVIRDGWGENHNPKHDKFNAVKLANKGAAAMLDDEHLLNGLNVHAGKLTYAAVGEALGLPSISAADALKI